MGTGNLNPHELNQAIEKHLLSLRAGAERARAAAPSTRHTWRSGAARLLKRAARSFLRAAERLEVGRLEEQASGA